MGTKSTYYIAFCDGASSGNPGPAGWGVVVVGPLLGPSGAPSANALVRELGAGVSRATNNQMEIAAAIAAIEAVPKHSRLVIYTDSKYLISSASDWIVGWIERGWATAEGKPVANRDLWQLLLVAMDERDVEWRHVRGHAGFSGNERADAIAVDFSQGKNPPLYAGALKGYGVEIQEAFLKGQEITDPKSRDAKSASGRYAKPVYLSYVGGVLKRHANWAACEAEVKGRAGAKYKKVESAEEEKTMLEKWGVAD